MIVADASVVVDMLLGSGSEAGDTLHRRLMTGEAIAAPHVLDAEVAQVLRRFVLRRHLDPVEAERLVDDLVGLRIRRYDHRPLLASAFRLWPNVTMYDALYLALAEGLGAPLLTGDAALAGVPGCEAAVEVRRTTG